MKIDRHNYEEFFLLYIDNELNVDQKKQVEAFVLANTDLEEELIMLQQSKLVADHSFVFDGKESLMKEESSINMSNYEEWLLLYTDNELTREQKIIVEKFAEEHEHVKKELDLFLQTKLESQEIVFADKASLYKTEEKVRVVGMSWWRIAAAAILLIAVGLGTYSIINNNKKSGSIETAGANPATKKSNQTEQKINNAVVGTKQENPEINPAKNIASATKPTQAKVDNKKESIPSEKNIADKNVIVKNDIPPTFTKTNEGKIASNVAESNPIIAKADINSSVAVNNPGSLQFNNRPVTKTGDGTPDNSKADHSTKFDDVTASNDENKKLRGFFRKATRFIERTTKVNPANDDNRVLIGSMAVSLK